MAVNNSINANSITPLPISGGGTSVSSVTTSPTANAFAGWDVNSNLSVNSLIEAYDTTPTTAGMTVLTVSSPRQQFFTGSSTQTVVMPVTSTLVLGQSWLIVNDSTGIVTVESSGSNTIIAMSPNTKAIITCILTSGTTNASWNFNYSFNNGGVSSITGTANQVIASSPTDGVTLSLPQSIATSSAVQFASVRFSTNNGLFDSNGNGILTLSPTASAVNHLQIQNNPTGFSPALQATGTDTNVTLFLEGKGNGGCSIQGVTSGNNATPGFVGEYLTNSASGVSLTTATATTVVSLSLTAGDWDVFGNVTFTPGGGINFTSMGAGLSTVSNTIQNNISLVSIRPATTTSSVVQNLCAGTFRMNVSSTTSVFLVAQSSFTLTTLTANGLIAARRIR